MASDKVDVLIKRAALALLAASNSLPYSDRARVAEVELLRETLDAYLTRRGHNGANYEDGDPELDGQSLSYLVHGQEEVDSVAAVKRERDEWIRQQKENLGK